MCTTTVTVWTYNTHLFGDVIGTLPGQGYRDTDRKHDIIKYYQTKPNGITFIAFEEIWDAGYAGDFAHDLDTHGGYTHYINDVHALEVLNKSGLALFVGPHLSFSKNEYFDYITNCNQDGWDGQDLPSFKGYLKARCDFTCSANHQHTLGLFATHMPTNYGKYPKSVSCCFQSLAAAVKQFRGQYPDAAIIVMGDLNIEGDSVNAEYTTLIQNALLAGTGLQNAAPPGSNVGYSINGETNTLWQYFNQGRHQPSRGSITCYMQTVATAR